MKCISALREASARSGQVKRALKYADAHGIRVRRSHRPSALSPRRRSQARRRSTLRFRLDGVARAENYSAGTRRADDGGTDGAYGGDFDDSGGGGAH